MAGVREQALTFVIVGAGPTGVELCAELRDFITEDVPKYYPHLLKVHQHPRHAASPPIVST